MTTPPPRALPTEPGEYYVDFDPAGPPLPAAIDAHHRNGWVRPRLRRAVVDALLAWLHHHSSLHGITAGWHGDTLILDEDDSGPHYEITPDDDGRYRLDLDGWCWLLTAPTDPDIDDALLAETSRLTPAAGEQRVTIDITGTHAPAFPALLDAQHRWARPRFRREVAEVLVAWLNNMHRAYPDSSDRAYWDGDTFVHLHPQTAGEDGYEPTRIEPDAEGRYAIGSQEWTWTLLSSPQ